MQIEYIIIKHEFAINHAHAGILYVCVFFVVLVVPTHVTVARTAQSAWSRATQDLFVRPGFNYSQFYELRVRGNVFSARMCFHPIVGRDDK